MKNTIFTTDAYRCRVTQGSNRDFEEDWRVHNVIIDFTKKLVPKVIVRSSGDGKS